MIYLKDTRNVMWCSRINLSISTINRNTIRWIPVADLENSYGGSNSHNEFQNTFSWKLFSTFEKWTVKIISQPCPSTPQTHFHQRPSYFALWYPNLPTDYFQAHKERGPIQSSWIMVEPRINLDKLRIWFFLYRSFRRTRKSMISIRISWVKKVMTCSHFENTLN